MPNNVVCFRWDLNYGVQKSPIPMNLFLYFYRALRIAELLIVLLKDFITANDFPAPAHNIHGAKFILWINKYMYIFYGAFNKKHTQD